MALLPGPLRRPFGVSRALAGPEDYRGATIGIRPGGVAKAAFGALGAAAKGYVPGALDGFDGAELDPTTIVYSDFERGAITANVVLWPKPYSIVMNREAFAALTPEQRELLSRAGREALAPELRQIERDEAEALSDVCRRGRPTLVTATDSERAALREAVQPVYDELERDALTRDLLAEIGELRGDDTAPLESPGCEEKSRTSAKAGEAAIEGRWETTWKRDALIAAGVTPKYAEAFRGRNTVEFADGRFRFHRDRGTDEDATGTYAVEGDIIRLVFKTGIALQLGRPYELRWSVYREKLTFSAAPGSEPLTGFLTAPYTRLR